MHVFAAGRRYRLIAMIVGLALLTTSSTLAEPDPQVAADGADCFDRLADGSNGTCSVLYAHVEDPRRTLLNVQAPPEHAPDVATGSLEAHGVKVRPNMGKIEWEEDGSLGGANLGGPAVPVKLARELPIRGYWYLAADSTGLSLLGPPEGVGGGVGLTPCITVEMLLVESAGDQERAIIAHGKTTRTILSMADSDPISLPVEETCEGSEGTVTVGDVHEFKVDLEPVVDAPVTLNGFALHILWYQADPSGDPFEEDKLAQPGWTVRSGTDHRPRLVLPIENPTTIASTFVEEEHGVVAASASLLSPWGSFEFAPEAVQVHHTLDDVAPETLRFSVFDETGNRIPTDSVEGPRLGYYPGHTLLGDDQLNVTYLWQPDPDLPAGLYTLLIEADNLQGTATARAEFVYEYTPASREESPVVGTLFIVSAVLGLLALTRRRGP